MSYRSVERDTKSVCLKSAFCDLPRWKPISELRLDLPKARLDGWLDMAPKSWRSAPEAGITWRESPSGLRVVWLVVAEHMLEPML